MEQYLSELFVRDLTRLKDEVINFKNEDNLWQKPDGISNTAGSLVVHLTGNINYNVGEVIGHNGYVRDRGFEFSGTYVPREKLITDLENAIEVVKKVFAGLNAQILEEQYTLDFLGKKSTAYYLLIFYGHLNYHLGQVNYLRRILEA